MSSTNSTKIADKIQRSLDELFKIHPVIRLIVQKIDESEGKALLVGGAVRDMLLNIPIKDVDIEVHNLPLPDLEQLLKQFGVVTTVGKFFGVLKLHGLPVDWSLPRTDTAGRKPKVVIDPHLSFRQAFVRRDLTINAMGIDLITHELIDPFNGQYDLAHRILRAPDPQFFVQDPLRFYRVMQFIARFDMYPNDELNELCKTMDVSQVSKERIEEEFKKMLLKSVAPSRGLRWLHALGRLNLFPELQATVGVKQEQDWHPEGDVFEHTMQAVDAAAQLVINDEAERLIILYAALCHDLGKVSTTEYVDGRLISYRHEMVGVSLAKKLLKRIMNNQTIIATVQKLVRYHMVPGQFVAQGATMRAYKRLALKLAPQTNAYMLGLLAYADKRGRNGNASTPLTKPEPMIDQFLEKAQQAQVLFMPESPVLKGADIIDRVKPGPEMGRLLKQAYALQINEGIKDKEQLKKMIFAPTND